jgi:type IV pilus assembly protein PilV
MKLTAAPQCRRCSRQQSGFMLIEAMVSAMLFALGILGMIRMQAESIRFSVDAYERNHAALMANELVAAMWASQSITPDADKYSAWQARLSDESISGLHSPSSSISAADANGAVTITISWKSIARGASGAGGSYTTTFVVPGQS